MDQQLPLTPDTEIALKSGPLEELTIESTPQLRIVLISDSLEGRAYRSLFELQNSELVYTTSDEAAKLLRQQSFDVAVAFDSDTTYLGALRSTAPQSLAIVAAGRESADVAAMQFCKTLADEYICLADTTSDHAKWILLRAVERRQLLIDAQQLRTTRTQTLDEDYHAAIHQVRALRATMLEQPEVTTTHPPEWLVAKLNELLKVYVVSISSELHDDVESFVEGLVQSGVTLHETLMAHSMATEQILLRLGHRPGWHALGRSQILAYQLTMFFLRSLKPSSNSSGIDWCEASLARGLGE